MVSTRGTVPLRKAGRRRPDLSLFLRVYRTATYCCKQGRGVGFTPSKAPSAAPQVPPEPTPPRIEGAGLALMDGVPHWAVETF